MRFHSLTKHIIRNVIIRWHEHYFTMVTDDKTNPNMWMTQWLVTFHNLGDPHTAQTIIFDVASVNDGCSSAFCSFCDLLTAWTNYPSLGFHQRWTYNVPHNALLLVWCLSFCKQWFKPLWSRVCDSRKGPCSIYQFYQPIQNGWIIGFSLSPH